nr:immunoglobulin light chain junction region [Macaca mulatta]
CQNYLNIPFTF